MFMSDVLSRSSYVVSHVEGEPETRCADRAGCGPWAGVVLVGVLWLKIVLLAICAIASKNCWIDYKVRTVCVEELRCRWACRAGIEKAVAILNEDPKESDDLTELWSDNEEDFNNVPLEMCNFTVRVIDESSKLNINIVTKDQLMELPNMLEDIADAIIDWRDNNDSASGLGVEGEYYETLTYPYTIRNGPFKTIRELLLVRGVTEELFYGEDTNFNGQLDYNENDGDQTPPDDDANGQLDYGWIHYLTCYSYANNLDADGEARVNINQGNRSSLEESLGISRSHAQWIVDNRSHDSIADLISSNSPAEPQEGNSNSARPLDLTTFRTIADWITVDNSDKKEGLVNINTASDIVLAALFGGGDEALQLAQDVIAFREQQIYGMESIADVLQDGGMSVSDFKKIADLITVRSDVYTIRSTASGARPNGAAGYTVRTEAVVDRSSTPYEVLYWYQGAQN